MARDDVKAEIDNRYRILERHRRRLQALEETEAQQGYSTPPEVLTEISDKKHLIFELENEISILEDSLHSPMSTIMENMSPGERANTLRLTSKRGVDRITSQIETLFEAVERRIVDWVTRWLIYLAAAVAFLYLVVAIILTVVIVRGS